jgi:signal transduction histidine kinase
MASLGHLTAGIAHEINNPINFVSSNVPPLKMSISEIIKILNTYRKANANDKKNIYLEEARNLEEKYDLEYLLGEVDMLLNGIYEGAERTKEIVLGLRNFSRVDKYELKKINLVDALNSTLLLLRNKYKDRIKIERNFDKNLKEIECYPGQLNQVLMNILNNAIQAISDKGTIIVTTEKIDNQAKIEIADDGKGIPKDYINNIFDPFYTTKDVGEGTGLGLSISYGIIQQHNGDISVKSEVGVGTTFIITIPVNHST